MTAPIERFAIRSSWLIYIVSFIVALATGSAVALFVFRFSLVGALLAPMPFILLGEIAAGQRVFTHVELGQDWVRLRSPFKRLIVSRSGVLTVELAIGSPVEDLKPFWSQIAFLHVSMADGRRIIIGTLEVALLRAIASRLSSQVAVTIIAPGSRG